jgi:hypothetical protein
MSVNPGFFNSFYWSGTYEIVRRQPYVDVLLLALFAVLWITKRREVASAALILSSPWIIVGVSAVTPVFAGGRSECDRLDRVGRGLGTQCDDESLPSPSSGVSGTLRREFCFMI